MRLEVVPAVSQSELAAIEHALAHTGIRLAPGRAAEVTRWGRGARQDAVEPPASRPGAYARSPRNTRGATRA